MSKNLKFKLVPMCEICGEERATSFSYFKKEYKWKFCGDCSSGSETYYIELERFFASPSSTVDWLSHMNEKTWMDWTLFMEMMKRFRAATNSFHST